MNQTNLTFSNEVAEDVQKIEREMLDFNSRFDTLHDKVKNGMISLEARMKLVQDENEKILAKSKKSIATAKKSSESKAVEEQVGNHEAQIYELRQHVDLLKAELMSKQVSQSKAPLKQKLLKGYANIHQEHQKLKKLFTENNAILKKIRDNSFKFHCEKSAIRFKEIEYHSRRDFYAFHRKLRDTFEIIFKMLKDAFKRDAIIVNNLYES